MADPEDVGSEPRVLFLSARISLVGIVASVVLLGHTESTRPHFYAILMVCVGVYVLARWSALLRSITAYLTSATMVWRWGFLVWAVASLFWTTRGGVALGRALTLVEIHALGVIFFDAAFRLRLTRLILSSVFACAALGAGHAVVGAAAGYGERVTGVFGNANVLAATAIAGLAAFHAGAGLGRRVLLRAVSHLLGLGLIGAAIVSGSRKGLVGVPVIWLLALAFSRLRRRVLVQVTLCLGVGGLAFAAVAPLRSYWLRSFGRVVDLFEAARSVAGLSISLIQRERFVREGLEMFWESPMVGRGLDAFRWLTPGTAYAHNNFIELGVSLGLVGLVLYYAFHAFLILRSRAQWRSGDPAAAFLLIFVVTVTFFDLSRVSYYMKLPSLLMVSLAGWLDASRQEAGVSVAAPAVASLRPADTG